MSKKLAKSIIAILGISVTVLTACLVVRSLRPYEMIRPGIYSFRDLRKLPLLFREDWIRPSDQGWVVKDPDPHIRHDYTHWDTLLVRCRAGDPESRVQYYYLVDYKTVSSADKTKIADELFGYIEAGFLDDCKIGLATSTLRRIGPSSHVRQRLYELAKQDTLSDRARTCAAEALGEHIRGSPPTTSEAALIRGHLRSLKSDDRLLAVQMIESAELTEFEDELMIRYRTETNFKVRASIIECFGGLHSQRGFDLVLRKSYCDTFEMLQAAVDAMRSYASVPKKLSTLQRKQLRSRLNELSHHPAVRKSALSGLVLLKQEMPQQ